MLLSNELEVIEVLETELLLTEVLAGRLLVALLEGLEEVTLLLLEAKV